MGIFEIVSGALLIVISVLIVGITLIQSKKDQGMTSAISGGANNDSFLGKNSTNTTEAKMERLTKVLAIAFFVITIGVNVISVVVK